MTNHLTIDQWIQYGLDMGYAETFCYTHDGSPMNDTEAEEYEQGDDPCIPTLRVWLEERSSPSSQSPNTQQPILFE
jgi:hypothetical protein